MYAIAQAFLTWPSHRSVVCPPPFLLATDTRAVCPCARLLFQLAEGAARCTPSPLKPCTSLCVPCTPSLSDAPLPCPFQASTRRSRCIACTSNHDSLVNLATRPDHIPFAIGRSASTVRLRRRQTCLAPPLAPGPSSVLPTTTCMYRHVALRRLVRSLESNTPNHSTS